MQDFSYSDFYLEELGGRAPMCVHAQFLDMMQYLNSVAPEGLLPGRQHIDPLDFRQVISLVNLVNVERDAGDVRFRYRLVGETQTRNAGRETTGLLLEDALVPELLPRVRANMRKVLSTRLAVFDSFPMPHPDRQFIISQRMYYPLAADGTTIDILLTLHGYEQDVAASGQRT